MALWLVRAGRFGEFEDLALKSRRALIGFDEVPDMSSVNSKEELFEILRNAYPDHTKKALFNFIGQLWAFLKRIQEDDLVILPLKTRSVIAVGKVTGPYEYKSDNPENARHTRSVEWIYTDIPRSALDQDLLYSIGAFMTVCQIQRNKAEERIRALVEGKPMPPMPPREHRRAGPPRKTGRDQMVETRTSGPLSPERDSQPKLLEPKPNRSSL